MIFTLPSLPYAYDALAPHIDGQTMKIHHTRHHQGYVDKLNQAVAGTAIATAKETEVCVLTDLLKDINAYHLAVRNNAGGHFNHSFFWSSLTPNNNLEEPQGALRYALDKSFGSFEGFKEAFTAAAAAHFGSGWAWLSIGKKDRDLFISTSDNQDNPIMNTTPTLEQGLPILGLDLWEHAYYLHYQNKRLAYIEAYWNIIDWKVVAAKHSQATK